ncbi:MAG TPA: KH domain-containing protein [Clostridiaceae bacterium]|nr:KH domain-containing protein [Clostridiaceae bacterium]
MKEFLEAIIVNLVNDKDSIVITEEQKENLVEYKVKVASDDMGKVIGKQGKTANAIRTLIKSLAGAQNKKVNIEFVD